MSPARLPVPPLRAIVRPHGITSPRWRNSDRNAHRRRRLPGAERGHPRGRAPLARPRARRRRRPRRLAGARRGAVRSRSARERSPASCPAAGRSSAPRARTRTGSRAASSSVLANFATAPRRARRDRRRGHARRRRAALCRARAAGRRRAEDDRQRPLRRPTTRSASTPRSPICTEAIDRLHTTAESHNRVMVVEVMGRHTGWIAVMSGIAGGADVILIPEHPITVEEACAELETRHRRGKDFSIVVVSEGYKLTYESGEQRRSRRKRSSTSSATSGSAVSASQLGAGDRGAHRLRDARHGARARPARRLADGARPRARHPLRAAAADLVTRGGSAGWWPCAGTRSSTSRSPRPSPSSRRSPRLVRRRARVLRLAGGYHARRMQEYVLSRPRAAPASARRSPASPMPAVTGGTMRRPRASAVPMCTVLRPSGSPPWPAMPQERER